MMQIYKIGRSDMDAFLCFLVVDNPHQGNLILYTTDVKLAEVKSLGLGYLQASGCFTFIFGYDHKTTRYC
jgi:hypothetical protein